MSTDLKARICHLESRFTFNEDSLEQLNQVLVTQQQQIDKLTKQVTYLANRIRSIKPDYIATPDEETPPPHY